MRTNNYIRLNLASAWLFFSLCFDYADWLGCVVEDLCYMLCYEFDDTGKSYRHAVVIISQLNHFVSKFKFIPFHPWKQIANKQTNQRINERASKQANNIFASQRHKPYLMLRSADFEIIEKVSSKFCVYIIYACILYRRTIYGNTSILIHQLWGYFSLHFDIKLKALKPSSMKTHNYY